ncbi:MAG: hypothetical protein ACREL7_04620 [Longimicrobiales bacterium]
MRAERTSRQAYHAWVEDQIEEFKGSLTRDELLDFAELAIESLGDSPDGQYNLTEILLRDAVDDLIVVRLGLPDYRRWQRTCQSDTSQRLFQGTPDPARRAG